MIDRYDINIEYYPGDSYSKIDPKMEPNGDWVRYEDHLEAVEELEYIIRALEEDTVFLTEENSILQEEVKYWKEKYFEYYEQDQL